jgi:hypothetical protein
MDFNSAVDLIIKDLEDARKIIDDLKSYSGVPEFQVELAKSKCKSAADVISTLKSTAALQVEKKSEKKPAPIEKPQPAPEPLINFEKEEPIRTFKETESSIIADTFAQQPGTIHDQIGGRIDDSDLHRSIRHKPVVNLSEAIGVNDKFLFIREIFNGSPETYNQAITRLDDTSSFDDAKAVIMSYAGEIKENGAASQLLELMKRKFPGNE